MVTPKLETDRLLLREIHADDAEAIFNGWMQDEDVSRYMYWKVSDDINEAKKFVEFELDNLEKDTWNRWLIVLRQTFQIIWFHCDADRGLWAYFVDRKDLQDTIKGV